MRWFSLVRTSMAETLEPVRQIPRNAKCLGAHAHFSLFRENMATTAKQAKTDEKNGAENADEQAGMLVI